VAFLGVSVFLLLGSMGYGERLKSFLLCVIGWGLGVFGNGINHLRPFFAPSI